MKRVRNNTRAKRTLKSTLQRVSFATYISVVCYFNKDNNADNFLYITNDNTGNKSWKDKSNKVVAKRILNIDEDDEYFVDNDILKLIVTNRK